MNNKKLTTSVVASFILATNIYSNDLSSITVTSATKSEQSIQDVTSNIEVITKEELQERHFTNVSEAINSVAGINSASNDNFYIRGMDRTRVLVLVDGIRINELSYTHGSSLLNYIDINSVEQIEIVKGAQSGIWGADASAGVINVITNKKKLGLSGFISGEYGSFNTKKLSTNIKNYTEKYYIDLNASYNSSNGISAWEAKQSSSDYGKRWDELDLENDESRYKNYSTKLGFYLNENNEISFNYRKNDSEYEYDSRTGDNLTNKSYIDSNSKQVNYTYKDENFSIKTDYVKSIFKRKLQTGSKYLSKHEQISLLGNINYYKTNSVLIGVDKQKFIDVERDREYDTKAFYVSNNSKFDKLNTVQTVRYDKNSEFEEKVTGKLGLKYNFTDKMNVSSNYGIAYNAPTLSNLSYNAELKPETAKTFDLNFQYDWFKITYFNNQIDDMIDYDASYVSGANKWYKNLDGQATFKGVEAAITTNVTTNTLLNLSYTYQRAKDEKSMDLEHVPKELLKASLDYYGLKDFHFNVNAEYVGKRVEYSSGYNIDASTGNYTVFNGLVNYQINKDAKVYLKLDNILDKFYQTVDGYATPERSAYIGFNYKF